MRDAARPLLGRARRLTLAAVKMRATLVEQAQQALRPRLAPGDLAIDATVGNGHDTAFLLAQVRPTGHVLGVDIQPAALAAAHRRLGASPCLSLLLASHAELARLAPAAWRGRVGAIMFNLGYLPGGDKRIITQAHSTLAALADALPLLATGGILSVIAYPGHPGGAQETAEVESWCASLEPRLFRTQTIASASPAANAPRLFLVSKAGQGGHVCTGGA